MVMMEQLPVTVSIYWIRNIEKNGLRFNENVGNIHLLKLPQAVEVSHKGHN